MLDLMRDPIASNADALWNAVGTVSTETGSKDLAPSTDAEWAAVRLKATALMEAADQLATPGRAVAHPDQKLKDPAGPGDLTPAQAQAAIDKDHAVFAGFAGVLKNAAGALVAAIDKRDVEAYQTAGGALDEACEACHKRYWYPESAAPPAP
jgi:cytochrome c556